MKNAFSFSLGRALAPVLLIVMSTQVHGADRGLYLGANVGQASFDIAGEFLRFPNGPINAGDAKDADTGWSIAVGYRFSSHIGIEGGYSDFGRASFSKSVNQPTTLISRVMTKNEVFGTLEVSGSKLAIVGSIPIGSWELAGKVGAFSASTSVAAESITSVTPIPPAGNLVPSTTRTTTLESTTTIDSMIAIGVNYAVGNHYIVSADWTFLFDVGDERRTGESDVSFLNLGFSYRF